MRDWGITIMMQILQSLHISIRLMICTRYYAKNYNADRNSNVFSTIRKTLHF